MRTRAPDFAVMPPHRPFLSTTSTLCIPARVRWNARLAPMTPAPMMIASAVCGIAALLPQSLPPNWRQQTPDILRLVLDDAIRADSVTRLGERLLHVLPTRVVVRRTGVAHSDDGTPDTAGSLLSVLLVTHDACPSA